MFIVRTLIREIILRTSFVAQRAQMEQQANLEAARPYLTCGLCEKLLCCAVWVPCAPTPHRFCASCLEQRARKTCPTCGKRWKGDAPRDPAADAIIRALWPAETQGQPMNEETRVALQREELRRQMMALFGNNPWYMRGLEVELKENPTAMVRCNCPGRPVAIKRRKAGSDRLYYGCPRWVKGGNDHCKLFRWASSDIQPATVTAADDEPAKPAKQRKTQTK